jgi:serine/threonine-protein kinase HipA
MIDDQHPGFELAQILEKEEGFLDYALECGAPVSGTTGVAGDAPKFTLSKSIHDRWYPGGSLSKKYIDSEWIIKFLRGRTKADHVILESEAQLYRLAEDLGLRGGFQPIYQDYALLIPRFDVVREGGELRRLGVESLSSTMGVFEFGQSASHENALKTIFKVTTSSLVEVAEYMMRDFFNTLIGNTDNHGRNTSLLKHLDGRIELSPLYDCAPMALDPQMITRTITWDEVERDRVCHGLPKLSSLWIWMEKCDMETELVKQELNKFLRKLDVLDLNDYNWPGDLLSFLEKNKKRMIESFL